MQGGSRSSGWEIVGGSCEMPLCGSWQSRQLAWRARPPRALPKAAPANSATESWTASELAGWLRALAICEAMFFPDRSAPVVP